MNTSTIRILLISLIVILGFGVRMQYLKAIAHNPLVQQFLPPNDSFYWVRAAKEFNGMKVEEPVLNWFPDHPYTRVLAKVLKSGGDLNTVRMLQIIVSMSALMVIFLIGNLTGFPLGGILGALIWALHRDIIFYDLQILKYSLTHSCIIISLYLMIRACKYGNYFSYALALGFICILAWFRVHYIMLLIPWAMLSLKRGRLISGCLLVLIVLLFLNHSRAKTHFGIHMYHGFVNNALGFYGDIPNIRDNVAGHFNEAVKVGEDLAGPYGRFKWVKNFWLQRVLVHITERPLNSLRSVMFKFRWLLFFDHWNLSSDLILQNSDHSFWHGVRLPLFILFGLSAYFLMAGLPYSGVLIFFVAIPFVMVLLTCVTKAYQTECVPVLIVIMAVGAQNHFEKNYRNRFLNFGLTGFIMACLVVYYHTDTVKPDYEESMKIFQIRFETEVKADILFEDIKQHEFDFEKVQKAYWYYRQVGNTLDAINLLRYVLKHNTLENNQLKQFYILMIEAYLAENNPEYAEKVYSEEMKTLGFYDEKVANLIQMKALELKQGNVF